MKKYIFIKFIIITVFFSEYLMSQNSEFEKDMIQLANQTVARIKQKNKLVVAVWFFHNTKGKKTEVGDYVGRDFSVHFTNVAENFEVVDRDHIEQLSAEHQWNEEGFIDPVTAKEVNKLIAADAIVTGTVDYTLHHLRVRIKIIDTETGKQIAAAIKTVRPDESLKFILNEEYESRTVHRKKEERVIVVEDENDPRSTNEDCERLKTGNYCFQNNTNGVYRVSVFTGSATTGVSIGIMSINAGQNACLFDLKENVYNFKTFSVQSGVLLSEKERGTIRVKKCKSLTYTINEGINVSKDKKNRKEKPKPKTKRNKTEEVILDIFDYMIQKQKNKKRNQNQKKATYPLKKN